MTPEQVWDILMREAGAHETDRAQFLFHWPECREFRFCGSLGFGGKVWAGDFGNPHRIDCYREDETPERLATIARVNALLKSGDQTPRPGG
jgi:hypothetical protein